MKHPKRSAQPATAVLPPPKALSIACWIHGLVALGLLAVCVVLYGATLNLGFFSLDDPDYIQNNPFITSLNAANLRHILSTPYFANYAPGHLLSYGLDIALAGGKNAWAMHLANVLWYGWVVCMVYVLAFAIRPHIATAAWAAVFFAVHPAHVEVVAWLSSRKDLVATGFAALSMTCYLLYRRQSRRRTWWYAGSLLSFLLASSGKQSVILLPAVMLAWDLLVTRRRGWQMVAEKIPFGLITVFFGWMTWQAQPSTRHSPDAFVLAMTQWSNLWLLSGFGQYVMYRPCPNPVAVSAGARAGIMAGALLTWTLPVLLVRWRQPIRAALCAWVLIQMLPPMALSFLTPITDRYLFLPSVGVCILVAGFGAGFAPRGRVERALVWILLGAVACLWGWKTWNYIGQWRDPRSVWYFAAAQAPPPQACEYSGEVYHEAGDRVQQFIQSGRFPSLTNDLALAEAVLADAARVTSLRLEWAGASAQRTNSVAYRDLLWRLAWEQYERALPRRGTLNTPNLFLRRGKLLVEQGKDEQAIAEFKLALKEARTHTFQQVRQENVTHITRAIGIAYWTLRNYTEAKQWFLEAQRVQKASGRVWIATLDQEVEKIKALAGGQ